MPSVTFRATHASRRSGGTAAAFITATLEPVPGEDVVHPLGDVPGPRVRGVDQHPATRHALGGHQVQQGLLLGVDPVLRQGRDLHEDVAGTGIEHRLASGAAVGVGQERLQVGGQQALGAVLQRLGEGVPERLEHVGVGAALGEPRRVLVRAQRGHLHLLVVGR